jgi:hypothetical protein
MLLALGNQTEIPKGDLTMKRILAITLWSIAVALVMSTQAKDVPSDVQKTLISLDKQWGEAGGDTAKLDKIIGDNMLAIGSKGEAQDKQQLIADNKATSANVQNAFLHGGRI